MKAFLKASAIFSLLAIISCWECTGHMIVWEIAMAELGDEFVNNHLSPLLYDQTQNFSQYPNIYEYACWPDEYKKIHNETASWHYIDIPFFDGYETNVTLDEKNVAWALNTGFKVLRNQSVEYPKPEMLRNLIHFAGDIHQPLHACQRYTPELPTGDQGGNFFRVHHPSISSLHALWDTALGFFSNLPRPLSQSSIISLITAASSITKEFPKWNFIKELEILDGFDIANGTDGTYHLAKQFAYKGILNNTNPS